ncbi:MAG TPA: tetratricopeptide repeat protein, partial [Saprospiraceae bacterium]|nr:tetratricopeptide repeat protein [Saprospiraceae bacterium]
SLANLYSKTEDYEKAFNYYNKAVTAALDLKASGNAAIILGNKGDLLIKMNRPEEALEVLQTAKKMLDESHFPERFTATNFLTQGIAYAKMNRPNEALKYYELSLDIGNANNSTTIIMNAKAERGILMIQQKKYKQALQDCRASKKTAQAINDTEYLIKTCNCLYQAQAALGDYKAALNNHQQYTEIRDSVYNETNIRKITQVGMQYDFDKKEAQQQLIIEKKNREKNQFRFALITVGLLLFGVYLFFKSKLKYQKTINLRNQELQQQKLKELKQKNKLAVLSSMIEGQEAERLRIAKDLHDSLGGLLSTIKIYFTKSIANNNNTSPSELTQKTSELIDEACIEVRRISHNMMPHALSISGLKGAVEDLSLQLQEQGFQTTLEINQLPDNIDNTKQIVLYRLIQEIISNIKKHAQAKNILIQLFGYDKEINLIIEDDGLGFDYDKAIKKDGLGLKSINSRVDFLDGKIEWDSQLHKGTTLTINIPL